MHSQGMEDLDEAAMCGTQLEWSDQHGPEWVDNTNRSPKGDRSEGFQLILIAVGLSSMNSIESMFFILMLENDQNVSGLT